MSSHLSVDPVRSRIMQAVGQKHTAPEMTVRRTLYALGYRFRVQRRDLPGSPDIVLRKHKTVIFVHGCFWHRHPLCKKATMPKTRLEFWTEKFDRNVARDQLTEIALRKMGWQVLIVWECETKSVEILAAKLASAFTAEAYPSDSDLSGAGKRGEYF
ncbi:DNA mismatch endonuclease Vsr [Rhodomicrobium vannielii ATCC 17100]|uniref:Very short patch repair endonuclease n=1 Tax=Rhodomicrobium vannielii (strain ATCC 17100 / DSM 162 / LMG 4299 / NCIMB 10020 / ATH 3.1.1) TaxID=648757 RepID=E3I786_RHOVT|nr:DNA mismatch endonuclease Vsr [Rhodomicrobium vannielii ATCC 17100]